MKISKLLVFLLIGTSVIPHIINFNSENDLNIIGTVSAWGSNDNYPDTIWEGIPYNDNISKAYFLDPVKAGICTNPSPLNVSTWSCDYYNISLPAKFYLRVQVAFDPTLVYNISNVSSK